MKLIIGGEVREYNEGITVAQLIVKENVETPEYVSVSLNDEFVANDAFNSTILKEDDVVEFIYFMGGGSFSWQ